MRLIHFVIHGPYLEGERQDLWSQVLECGLLLRWVPLLLSHGSSVRIHQCGSRGVWDFTPRNVVWGKRVQLYRTVTHSWTSQTQPSHCMREGRLAWNCVVMIKAMILCLSHSLSRQVTKWFLSDDKSDCRATMLCQTTIYATVYLAKQPMRYLTNYDNIRNSYQYL